MADTTFSFYQVSNSDQITTGYPAGAIVFNKLRHEISVFNSGANVTVYAGGLQSATLSNEVLRITDNTGTALTVDMSVYTTTNEVKDEIDKFLKDNLYVTTVYVEGQLANYYTKKEVDGKFEESNDDIESLNNAVRDLVHTEYVIRREGTAENGFATTYQLYKIFEESEDTTHEFKVGDPINIPKDLVVKSGTVETIDGIPNIVLVLNDDNDTEIKIPVNDLVDSYTAATNGYIIVDNNTNTISLDVDKAKNIFVYKDNGTAKVSVIVPESKDDMSSLGTSANPYKNIYGTLIGNADTATKATNADTATKAQKDQDGNIITETYATKAGLYWKQLD